jgi:ferric-chelate reductase [NAD(P)H]
VNKENEPKSTASGKLRALRGHIDRWRILKRSDRKYGNASGIQTAPVAVAINKENLTCEYIRKSQVFAASVLGTDAPMEVIGRFGFRSGRDIDKFESIRYRTGTTGAPVVLDHAIAYIEVAVTQEVDVGTHVLFIGEVVDANILREGEPMTYAYYHQVKGGKTPDKATVYIGDED